MDQEYMLDCDKFTIGSEKIQCLCGLNGIHSLSLHTKMLESGTRPRGSTMSCVQIRIKALELAVRDRDIEEECKPEHTLRWAKRFEKYLLTGDIDE